MRRFLIGLVLSGLALVPGLSGQAQPAGQAKAPEAPQPVAVPPATHDSRDPAQAQDADFLAAVRAWTTKPEFLSPLVDHLPVAPGIPTPKEVLDQLPNI